MGRSPPWLPPPLRSRSSLPPRGSTPSGSEAPSSPPSPPSSKCGSQAGVRRVRSLHRPQEVLLSPDQQRHRGHQMTAVTEYMTVITCSSLRLQLLYNALK